MPNPATTLPFGQIRVYLGDGATPTVYSAPCGLNSSTFTLAKATSKTVVPDCTDPDAVAWEETDAQSRSATIDGDGVMARQSMHVWRAAYEGDTSIPARVEIGGTGATGGGHWDGKFHVTSYQVRAQRGSRATLAIRMENDGAVLFTAAA